MSLKKQHHSFHLACVQGDLAHVEVSLRNPAIVELTVKDQLGLQYAADRGHVAIVDRLLQLPGSDPTIRNHQPFRLAAHNGHLLVVERLLQEPTTDATAEDNYALRIAASNGHFFVVQRLLQAPGVDPTAQNNRAVSLALEKGYVEIVELLLQDERVVRGLGLAPDTMMLAEQRGAWIMAQCSGTQRYRELLGNVYRTAYECVKGEVYVGMAEQVCGMMWPDFLGRLAVQAQRQLVTALHRLRK
eukprot:TRINITY_DN14229_c0_g1_i3.p1 TRINITY_DN14229_c0_g1~~TRINITY_DN14229_c0_g1_i3.p1  ORF type:complete len:244 (+),score=33.59 TRINITY_DN14229_c0_g1_i3:66-797(+)